MVRTHQDLDARSLAMHRLIAERIRADPRLLETVKGTIARWRSTSSPDALPYLDEWDRLVRTGLDALLAVAVEDSERARTLRQSSPFTRILSPQERHTFLKDWERAHDSR